MLTTSLRETHQASSSRVPAKVETSNSQEEGNDTISVSIDGLVCLDGMPTNTGHYHHFPQSNQTMDPIMIVPLLR